MKKNEYWIIDVQLTPGSRMFRTVANIYRIDKDGDVGFTMCGDEDIYWRSQFEWFDPVRKVDME